MQNILALYAANGKNLYAGYQSLCAIEAISRAKFNQQANSFHAADCEEKRLGVLNQEIRKALNWP